jgi:transposase-like protein
MIRGERKFYSRAFREQVLTAYYHSNESIAMIARRFQVKKGTVSSWIYRKNSSSNQENTINLEASNVMSVKKEKLTPEQMEQRILDLEQELEQEKMRSLCLDKMIDIAERELKIDIRKKSGAKQSKK